MSSVLGLHLRRELLMDTQAIRDSVAAAHQPRQVPHYPGALLCSCGKLEPLDKRPVYIEFTAAHVIDAYLAALQIAAIELVQRAEFAPPRAAGDYNTPRCPAGCDCSCCYGFADKSCHCFADPCNCGGDRAAHGQKPLTTDPEETTGR